MGGLPYESENKDDDGDGEEEKSIFKEWWKYLKPLSEFARYFAKHKLKGFNMVPMTRLTARYIFLDTDAFHGVLSRIRTLRKEQNLPELAILKDLPNLEKFKEGGTECAKWWRQCFDVQKLETCNKVFGMALSTDGYGTSVSMLKMRRRETLETEQSDASDEPDKYGFKEDKTYDPLTIQEGTRVVGLDPGKDPFTGVDENDQVFRCTKKEYYQECGFNRAQNQRTRWTKKNRRIKNLIRWMPSSKTIVLETYLKHCKYILANDQTLLRFYGHKRWRKQRFHCEIGKQRFEMKMVRRITGGDANCVVALGNGNFAHNLKGHPSTPTKRLYKLLRRERVTVRMIDEFRTSVTCSLCEGELPKVTRFWKVKVCNDVCLTHWNRDVNAARNILKIFFHMQENKGERPFCMRRKQTS